MIGNDMNSASIQRLIDIAASDPDIDLESFTQYAKANYSPEQQMSRIKAPTSIQSNTTSVKKLGKKLETLKFNDDNGIRDIQGSKARPGFAPTLKRYPDLREDPEKTDSVYEVFYNDTITLKEYRQMARDPQLKLGLLLITGLVSGLKYSVTCKDQVIRDVIKTVYDRHHNALVRKMIKISFREGFSFAEKIYQRETVNVEGYSGKVVGLREVSFQDPDNNFRFYKSKDSNQIHSVAQRQNTKEVTLNRARLLWFSLDEEFGEVFGESRFKPAYPYWYYDKIGYQWRTHTLEKTGAPHLEGRYPIGSTQVDGQILENGEILIDTLVTLTSTGNLILPSSRDEKGNYLWDVSYKEPRNTSTDAFDKYSEYNDRKKLDALGIMGSIFEKGSFSDTDAKADLLMAILEDAINQIQTVIASDIIDYLVAYNFGQDRVNEVKFEIDRTGLGRRSMLKEILINAMRIQSSVPNYRPKQMIDIRGLLDEFGIDNQPFDTVMEEDIHDTQNSPPTQTPLEQQQRVEDGNTINRPNETVKDRGRTADRKSIT